VAEVTLRQARPDEASALSELALRAKAHWDYTPEFIEACREELTVHRAEIVAGRVTVAEEHGSVVGFSTVGGDPPVAEVDMLFVEPEWIGSGVGSVLFDALRANAVATGFTRLRIESDPNATGFYERTGAVVVGEEPSVSIPGRMLPLLELDLTTP
jgi:GNAT superfamily N-acetyltransferase